MLEENSQKSWRVAGKVKRENEGKARKGHSVLTLTPTTSEDQLGTQTQARECRFSGLSFNVK